jgi:hypothetical protein
MDTKSLVKSLVNENISNIGKDLINHAENNGEESRWHKRWVIHNGCIDPSEEEVVISVWETFCQVEEFMGSSFVEPCSCIG